MSTGVIRKEQATQLGRWEPEAFSEPPKNEVKLPTVDEINRVHKNAHSEGFEEGFRQGSNAAVAEAARLTDLLTGLQADLGNFEQQIAEKLMGFALTLSQTVLRTALDHHPELILPVVREALAEVPPVNNTVQLHLHPQDAALLRKHGGELIKLDQIEFVEDPRLEPGGCRVRNSSVEIDATLAVRWRRALATLGRDDAWFKEKQASETNGDDATQ
jgi:flagellar assembly protein FliH